MKTGCIYSIEITTNTNEIFSVSSDYFDHFYIANIMLFLVLCNAKY